MVERAASQAVAVVVDREDRVVSWSREAERLLGYDGAAVLGRPLLEVLDGRDVFGNRICRNGCWMREMWSRGEPVQRFEMNVRHAEGHRLRLIVDPEPQGEAGGCAYWLAPDQRQAERRRAPPPAEPLSLPAAPPVPLLSLTRREHEVLHLLARGAETPEIAREFGISNATARNHIQHLLEKLGAHTRLQVVSLAHRNGLL